MGPQPPGAFPGRLGPGRKNSKLPLDNFPRSAIIAFVPRGGHENLAGLCKGSTTDSDSVCEGSNPSPAAKRKGHPKGCPFLLDCPGRRQERRLRRRRLSIAFRRTLLCKSAGGAVHSASFSAFFGWNSRQISYFPNKTLTKAEYVPMIETILRNRRAFL